MQTPQKEAANVVAEIVIEVKALVREDVTHPFKALVAEDLTLEIYYNIGLALVGDTLMKPAFTRI